MTAALEMPRVQECAVPSCAYNHTNDCHAFAITIGSSDHAHCHTFVELPVRGGIDQLDRAGGRLLSAPTAGTTRTWSATPRRSPSARTTTWPTA